MDLTAVNWTIPSHHLSTRLPQMDVIFIQKLLFLGELSYHFYLTKQESLHTYPW